MKKKFAYVCIAIAVLIWSTTYLLSKDVLADVKPGVIIFVRSFLATVFLSFFCIGKIKGRSKKMWLINIATGVVVAFAYLTQVEGLQYTTPAKNGFLENTYCIVVPFIVWILERKRPSIKSWICIAVCFIGVIFISLDSLRGGLNAKQIGGDLLSGLAGVLFGVNIALTGRFVKDENPIVYTTCQFFVVAVVSGVYLLIRKAFGTYELAMNISPKTVWVLIYLGIGAMAICFIIFILGIFRHIPVFDMFMTS